MNIKYCERCGSQNDFAGQFCNNCGLSLQNKAPEIRKKGKTNWILVTVLLVVAGFLGVAYIADQKQQNAFNDRAKEIARLETTVYTEPKIGMILTKFLDLCGKETDDFRTYESSRNTITTVTYKYSEKNQSHKCVGTFTFVNYQLDSIFRN